MPDGRFLGKSVSHNEQLASVSIEAALLFTWCIPHLDREGRLQGHPDRLKAIACPMRPEITAAAIPDLLRSLGAAGLVRWYEVDGKQVLEFPGFKNHQKGARFDREAPSRLPASDSPGALDLLRSNSGPTPDEVRLRGREGEVEVKRSEGEASSSLRSKDGAGRRSRKPTARKGSAKEPRWSLPAPDGEYHAELAPVIREVWWQATSDRPPTVLSKAEDGKPWTLGRELDIAKRLASEHTLTPAEMGEILRSARTLVDVPAGPVSLRIFAMNGRRDLFNRVLHELAKQRAHRSTANGAATASQVLKRIGFSGGDDGD